MIVVGQDILLRAAKTYPDARRWIDGWIELTLASQWRSIIDVRRDYPSADGVKLKDALVVTVFNVTGNKYRLLTVIRYVIHTVQVRQLLTHAEYDNQKWK